MLELRIGSPSKSESSHLDGAVGYFFPRAVDKSVDILWTRFSTGGVDKFIPRVWTTLWIRFSPGCG
jgi:hypothetical protein